MCHNTITGGHINVILGSQHEDDPPTSMAQNGCHSNGATKSAVNDLVYQKVKRL